MRQGEGVRAAGAVVQGGYVSVDVGPNDSTIEVSAAGSDKTQSHSVTPNKTATFPVPQVPPGTILFITVGKGLRARVIEVEVIAPSP